MNRREFMVTAGAAAAVAASPLSAFAKEKDYGYLDEAYALPDLYNFLDLENLREGVQVFSGLQAAIDAVKPGGTVYLIPGDYGSRWADKKGKFDYGLALDLNRFNGKTISGLWLRDTGKYAPPLGEARRP